MSKVIWITGASSGIGEALVYQLNAEGNKLIISSRDRSKLFKVKQNCKNQIDVHVLPLDLEEISLLNQKTQDALKIYGYIDVLINSGGISQRALAMDTSLQTEQCLMNVNFWGTVVLSKAVLPSMLNRNQGTIVCISSLVGKFGTRYRSAYAASKHALHGYFDSLRIELADTPIHFLMVCPGFIHTQVTINALTADGSTQGTMDDAQANGMPAGDCAKAIVKAIKEKKEEVYIGGKEVKAIWLKRFFPRYFSKMIKKAKVV